MVLYFKLTFYLKIAKGILVLSIYCLLNDLFFQITTWFSLRHGCILYSISLLSLWLTKVFANRWLNRFYTVSSKENQTEGLVLVM